MTSANPAATVVRNWVELYTRGLVPELRDARRAEIESDLWAQAEEAEYLGRGPVSVGVEMLTRLALGVPADIGWRRSHRAAGTSIERKERSMREPRSRHVLTAIGIALALFDLVGTLASTERSTLPAVATLVVGAALALVGLLVVGRLPIAGGATAIVGGAMIGAVVLIGDPGWLFGYLFFVPIVVIGAARAWQVLEAQRRQTA